MNLAKLLALFEYENGYVKCTLCTGIWLSHQTPDAKLREHAANQHGRKNMSDFKEGDHVYDVTVGRERQANFVKVLPTDEGLAKVQLDNGKEELWSLDLLRHAEDS